MGSVNVTVRMEEETKQQFDAFCKNVGINLTTAVNMFAKATLRNRQLPFLVTDMDLPKQIISTKEKAAPEGAKTPARKQAGTNGADNTAANGISTAYVIGGADGAEEKSGQDDKIAEVKKEKQKRQTKKERAPKKR